MSLVRFKGQNPPQQSRNRGARPEIDDRATDPTVFVRLQGRFGFTVDAAALPHNAKLPRFWTSEDDGLAQSWAGERVWCNPPYSNIEAWVEKAWREMNTGAVPLIVMLLPANRTEQRWWQVHVEPYRDREAGLRTEFLGGRMRFINSGKTAIGTNERPPFGVVLLIWDHARAAKGAR